MNSKTSLDHSHDLGDFYYQAVSRSNSKTNNKISSSLRIEPRGVCRPRVRDTAKADARSDDLERIAPSKGTIHCRTDNMRVYEHRGPRNRPPKMVVFPSNQGPQKGAPNFGNPPYALQARQQGSKQPVRLCRCWSEGS